MFKRTLFAKFIQADAAFGQGICQLLRWLFFMEGTHLEKFLPLRKSYQKESYVLPLRVFQSKNGGKYLSVIFL